MVEGNIGIGEALANTTRLSGDFGSPISRGLQLNAKNDFANIQAEQQRQAKLDKQQEEMAKLATFDDGKWYSAKRAREVKDYIGKKMPELMNAYKSGDRMKMAQIQNEIKGEIAIKHIVDRDEKSLNETSDKSVTKSQALELYNKGGVDAIKQHNQRYFFAPIGEVDEESGSFKIYNVSNPNIDKLLSRRITEQIKNLPTTKLVKGGQGEIITEIDPNSNEYKAAKQNVISGIIENDDLVDQIVHTKDFKNYYDKYLETNKIADIEADEIDVEDALKGFVEEKYKLNEGKKVRYKSIPSGGGSKTTDNPSYYSSGKNSGRWNFTPIDNGSIEVEVEGNPSAKPVFNGTINGEEASRQLIKPNVKYIGNDMFEVSGLVDLGQGILNPIPKPLRVSKSSITSIFGLTEQGLKAKLGYKSQAAPASKPTKKDSFPVWRSKNLNGTPAQYKSYLNN